MILQLQAGKLHLPFFFANPLPPISVQAFWLKSRTPDIPCSFLCLQVIPIFSLQSLAVVYRMLAKMAIIFSVFLRALLVVQWKWIMLCLQAGPIWSRLIFAADICFMYNVVLKLLPSFLCQILSLAYNLWPFTLSSFWRQNALSCYCSFPSACFAQDNLCETPCR